MNQNFFKVDHRYNPTRPRPLPLQYPRFQASSSLHPTSTTSNKVVIAAAGATAIATATNSYSERINSILNKWHLLQEEEINNKKKKTKYQEKDEFNCRIEENLQNQLYELEQVMNEHLEQEYSQHSINEYKQDDMEQFMEMQKLLTIEDQKLKKYSLQQSKFMNFELWKQKHELYLKQMMNKAHQMQTNKVIRLLKAYFRTKKYYVQASKQYKN